MAVARVDMVPSTVTTHEIPLTRTQLETADTQTQSGTLTSYTVSFEQAWYSTQRQAWGGEREGKGEGGGKEVSQHEQ